MPLDLDGLEDALVELFGDPPPSSIECAQAWADAMKGYAAAVVPASTAVNAAAATFATALGSAFAIPGVVPPVTPPALAAIESAFAAFALAVGGGMAGFVATPPIGPVGFAALFALPMPTTAAAGAARIAARIDVWFRTGMAAPVGSPTPAAWS